MYKNSNTNLRIHIFNLKNFADSIKTKFDILEFHEIVNKNMASDVISFNDNHWCRKVFVPILSMIHFPGRHSSNARNVNVILL